MTILDGFIIFLSLLSLKIGFGIVGPGRGPLSRFYAIVVPLVDFLPVFILAIGIIGLISDALRWGDVFI